MTNMQICIKIHNGYTFSLEIESSDTVETLKEKIKAKEGIPIDEQNIYLCSRGLQDNRTLSDYNI